MPRCEHATCFQSPTTLLLWFACVLVLVVVVCGIEWVKRKGKR